MLRSCPVVDEISLTSLLVDVYFGIKPASRYVTIGFRNNYRFSFDVTVIIIIANVTFIVTMSYPEVSRRLFIIKRDRIS